MARPIIIHIFGDSGGGKTTLIEKLIPFLKKMGYRLGAIKHAPHGFDMDVKGKDSHRMAKAGADIVIVSSPNRDAIFKKKFKKEKLSELIKRIGNEVDIILIEGYKDYAI